MTPLKLLALFNLCMYGFALFINIVRYNEAHKDEISKLTQSYTKKDFHSGLFFLFMVLWVLYALWSAQGGQP